MEDFNSDLSERQFILVSLEKHSGFIINVFVKLQVNHEHFEINWTQILKFDPFKCALALICQISAGAESQNPEATNIKALIQ